MGLTSDQKQRLVDRTIAGKGWGALCDSMKEPVRIRLVCQLIQTSAWVEDRMLELTEAAEKTVFVEASIIDLQKAMDEAVAFLMEKIHHDLFERLAAVEGESVVAPGNLEDAIGRDPHGFLLMQARTYATLRKAGIHDFDFIPDNILGHGTAPALGRRCMVSRDVDEGDLFVFRDRESTGRLHFEVHVQVSSVINTEEHQSVGVQFSVRWGMTGPHGVRRLLVKEAN